jgi:hypothetical protein
VADNEQHDGATDEAGGAIVPDPLVEMAVLGTEVLKASDEHP